MANESQQGTGKHPHKDSEEPYPHTKQAGEHSSGGSGRSSGSDESSSEEESLERREYRDSSGEEHHHTRTYMEQHGKESGEGEEEE